MTSDKIKCTAVTAAGKPCSLATLHLRCSCPWLSQEAASPSSRHRLECRPRPLYPIIDSIHRQYGREYLLLFSRQSGKNEAIAHLRSVFTAGPEQVMAANPAYGQPFKFSASSKAALGASFLALIESGRWMLATHFLLDALHAVATPLRLL